MSRLFEPPDARALIALALAEDLGVEPHDLEAGLLTLLERDVTTSSVLSVAAGFSGRIVAREDARVCGLPVAEQVWSMLAAASGLPGSVEMFPLVAEGADVTAGTPVAEVEGPAAVVLPGERTALNLLMLMSGIATAAHAWISAAPPGLVVLDTRKTLPGMRGLAKYAVRVGGASNHREGLWDMVLIKDNHIRHSGGIAEAVAQARSANPGLLVEVEADSVEQAVEAASAGADIVLLDNMDDATLAEAVAAVRSAAELRGAAVMTEASGGVTIDRLEALGAAGVDRVSTSALTLAPPVDFGLDEVV